MSVLTRPLSTGGPYRSVPGAAPPLDVSANNPGEGAQMVTVPLSRLTGMQDTLNPHPPNVARDLTNPDTGPPLNEAPGMFARLAEEAATGG